MDTETKEMLQAILTRMDGMETRFDEKLESLGKEIQETKQSLQLEIGEMGAALEARIEDSQRQMEARIVESQRETMVFVENSVGKRIDSLFDGYKLTHEKQWELERRMEHMEKRLSELENKAG